MSNSSTESMDLPAEEATRKRKRRNDYGKKRGPNAATTRAKTNTTDANTSKVRTARPMRGPERMRVIPDTRLIVTPDVPLVMEKYSDFASWLDTGYTQRGLTEVQIPGYYVIEANTVWFQTLVNPNGLLTAEHIDALLNLLINTSRRAPRAYVGGWALLESQGWIALSSDAIANRPEHIIPYVEGAYPIQGGIPWKVADKICGVGHVGQSNNGHWVLFEAVVSERKIVVYDSLSRTTNWNSIEDAFNNVRFNLNTLLSGLDNRYADRLYWELVSYNHPPQQTNMFDCGVMAIKYLECILTGRKVDELDPNRASNWRYVYGAALYRMGIEYGNQMEYSLSAEHGI